MMVVNLVGPAKERGQHLVANHTPKECSCDKEMCPFCRGGLFACTVCDSAEGATTSECPGYRISSRILDAVYSGDLDFKDIDGTPQWVVKPYKGG